MKPQSNIKTLGTLILSLTLPLLASAANIALNANDGLGQSSFNSGSHWVGGAAPSAANDYNTGGFMLRTPGDALNYTFAGASMTFTNPNLAGAGNGSLLDKNALAVGASRTLTINNLTNANGALVRSGAANGTIVHIAGNHYTIAGNSSIWADQNIWIIDSPLVDDATTAGTVILTNRSSNVTPANHIAYSANNSAYTGGWLIIGTGVNANNYVELLAANSMPGNPAVFNPAQINIGPNGILLDTAGSTFNNTRGGFTLSGSAVINSPATTIIAEPITGGFSLTKTGAGTLRLDSPNNTYSGGTIISAGILQMGVANALTNNGSVTDNSSLDLNGFSLTIDGLSGSGTVDTTTPGTPTLTVGANGGGGSFSGSIQNSAGTLSLTKTGAGALTLAGGYSYSGQTLVAGGTLNLSTAAAVPGTPGNVVVSNAAVLAVDASVGTALPANNLVVGANSSLSITLNNAANGLNLAGTLTFQDNSTNNFNFGNLTANPTGIAINAAGSISAPGTNIVINISGLGLQPGAFALIKYTGSVLGSIANFTLNLPPGVAGGLVNNTGNHSIDLNITSIPNQLAWDGVNGTSWDLVTANWSNIVTGAITVFRQYTNGAVIAGDSVLLDDSVTNDLVNPQPTNLTLNSTFFAFPVTVNSTLPFSIRGAGGITGPTSLIKSNTGSLTLLTSNSFAGGVSIHAGSLIITNDSALGASAGALTLNGGALQLNGNTTNSRVVTVTANSTIGVATNVSSQLGGALSGAGGLTKTDNGTLTLTGPNTITGALTVSQGTLNSSGTETLTAVATVGNTAGVNGTLNITGGAFNARNNGGQFASSLIAGSAAGAAGDIRVSAGALSIFQQFGLGSGAGGYAGFNMSGGSLFCGSYIVVGFNTDTAVYSQSAGTCIISNNVMTIAAGGTSANGVANFSGGTYTSSNAPAVNAGMFVGENGNGTLNISGSASVLAVGQANVTLGRTGAGSAGTANLLGGTLSTFQVSRGAGTGVLNFNGGTLKATAANPSFMTGLTAARIYNNGATFDDGGFAITVAQPLSAVTGFGVATIPVANGGSGYIDTPLVTISGGNGSNAMATALVSGGAVTAINVTCPGGGYLNGDVLSVAFTGGGATPTPPTIGTITYVANGTGGLTKKGSGTTTLSGINSFTGPITNSAGTLLLNSASTYTGSVAVNGGALQLTTAPALQGNTTVTNNATLSVVQIGTATSTISNLTLNGGAVLPGATLGLTISTANNPNIALLNCGTLTVNGTNTINLAAVNVGTLALVKYFGAIAGSGTITNLTLPQGATGYISNNAASSTLYAVITSTGPGLVWTGTSSVSPNVWDINASTNWLVAATATSYHQIISPGDAVTFSDIGSGTVILNTNVAPASLTISNNTKNYTFQGNGTISGSTGLLKLGTGTATLNLTNNTYLANTIISNGTLKAGSPTALSPTANLIVGPTGTFEMAGFDQTVNELTGSGIVDDNSPNSIVLTVTGNTGGTWNGTIQDQSLGGIALVKSGTGTWVVGGNNFLNNGNAFTTRAQFNGGTTIVTNGGLVSVSLMECWIAGAVGSTSTVVVAGGTFAVTNNWFVIGRGEATANGTLIVNSGTVRKAGANSIIIGSLGATGTLEVNGGQVLNTGEILLGENATANAYLNLNGGTVQATDIRPTGAAPAISTANFNGGTLQAVTNTSDFLQVSSMVLSNGLILDDNGFSVTISSQPLQSGDAFNGGLVKKGPGTVYLDSASSYTGTTLITNGTLAGIGSVAGPVIVAPTGNLGAGNAAAIGFFTANNNLSLHGNATLRIDKTGGNPTKDQVIVAGNISYGGVLTITNTTSDATPLVNGDSFQLFSVTGTHAGDFAGINGTPAPGLSYAFDPVTGTLSVVNIPNNPTNITVSVTGNSLNLSWPADHLGWILQTQTNSLATGLTTNWVDIAGTASVTSTNLPIVPTTPDAFFRLRHP